MRIRTRLVRLLILTVLALPLTLGCQASAPRGGRALPTIKVLPFTLEPQSLAGASAGPRETLETLLITEAAFSAGEVLVREGLGEIAGAASITGTVQIPVSLPPDVRGLRAHRQKGRLANAWEKGKATLSAPLTRSLEGMLEAQVEEDGFSDSYRLIASRQNVERFQVGSVSGLPAPEFV